ncbi:MAG: AAA family ATPase [Vicinamibacterales bacterium]
MYERFFGFRERPFDLTPNPRFLVLTDSHREVLSNLEYGISSKKGVTLVVGEAGSGKTTLIRTVLERQPQRVHSVHLNNPMLSRDEFVETLAGKFGLSDRAAGSKAVMLQELEVLLAERHARGETTVLIVDEAQSLSLELLEEVRLLANTETNEEKLLPVILAGQPELADRLNDQNLRQLKQRVALRCELLPLSDRDTAAYVAGRIAVAGGVASQVFTREAVSLIHKASRGVPRMVSVLADNALLGGFARGEKPVGSRIVAEVCRDFDLLMPVESAPPPVAVAVPSQLIAERAAVEPQRAQVQPGPTTAEPSGGLVTVPAHPGQGLFAQFALKRKRFFNWN